MTFFTPKISIYPAKFLNDLFYYCTNSLSSLHTSSHHCIFSASLHVEKALIKGHSLEGRSTCQISWQQYPKTHGSDLRICPRKPSKSRKMLIIRPIKKHS